VVAKGMGKVGYGQGPRACRGLACLSPVLVCIRIAFSPYIAAVVCLIYLLLSEIDNNEEQIEKVSNKSLWRVNDNFLNAFHKMLLLTVDCALFGHIITISLNVSE
jgi:hypothetical protein